MMLPLVPEAVQTAAGAAMNVTGLPEPPPVALQVPVPPNTMGLVQVNEVMVWLAWATVIEVARDVVPL